MGKSIDFLSIVTVLLIIAVVVLIVLSLIPNGEPYYIIGELADKHVSKSCSNNSNGVNSCTTSYSFVLVEDGKSETVAVYERQYYKDTIGSTCKAKVQPTIISRTTKWVKCEE